MGSVLVSSLQYDVDALAAEVAVARRLLDFGAGAYGHSLSIPAEEDIQAAHRSHVNNNPYAGALGVCPLFADIFSGFRAEKAAYRLLLRKAGTAYSLHDDRDAGDDIVRMQMPLVTNRRALLLVQKDGAELMPIARQVDKYTRGDGGTPIKFDYRRLSEEFGEWFDAYYLEPGYFHLIDTTRVHTLVNAGDADRITLCIDILRNEWMENWLSQQMVREIPVVPPDSLPDGTWEWGALRHGLLTHPRVRLN